jgi:ribonuclease HI
MKFGTLNVDGSTDHEWGEGSAAAILKLPDSNEVFFARERVKTFVSSDAEMHAFRIGLGLAREHGVSHLVVYSDFEALVRAVNADGRFPRGFEGVAVEVAEFCEVTGVFIEREDNGHADLLARSFRSRKPRMIGGVKSAPFVRGGVGGKFGRRSVSRRGNGFRR